MTCMLPYRIFLVHLITLMLLYRNYQLRHFVHILYVPINLRNTYISPLKPLRRTEKEKVEWRGTLRDATFITGKVTEKF